MGQPLFRPGVHLRARAATEDEWVIYDKEARAAKAPEDIMFVYLVDLGSVLNRIQKASHL